LKGKIKVIVKTKKNDLLFIIASFSKLLKSSPLKLICFSVNNSGYDYYKKRYIPKNKWHQKERIRDSIKKL
tara:strand:+ start:1899 stop:2111 length:213 start_codon:yes stop_codon:yes gene_type:complete